MLISQSVGSGKSNRITVWFCSGFGAFPISSYFVGIEGSGEALASGETTPRIRMPVTKLCSGAMLSSDCGLMSIGGITAPPSSSVRINVTPAGMVAAFHRRVMGYVSGSACQDNDHSGLLCTIARRSKSSPLVSSKWNLAVNVLEGGHGGSSHSPRSTSNESVAWGSKPIVTARTSSMH